MFFFTYTFDCFFLNINRYIYIYTYASYIHHLCLSSISHKPGAGQAMEDEASRPP